MDQTQKPKRRGKAQQAEQPPEARLEKIAKLKKAIEDGTYRISNDDVARKLIEHMLEPKE
jgi:flagellar biosynthesis anti-sigma factor FlgM